jgi:ferredoxin
MGQEPIAPTLSTPPIISDPERCSGCGRCVAACPEKLYTLEITNYRKHAINRNPAKCILCGKCVTACPLGIIEQSGLHRTPLP